MLVDNLHEMSVDSLHEVSYLIFWKKELEKHHLSFYPANKVFSSPEPKAQGEVLWSLTVRRRRRRRPSVRPFTIF